MLYNQLADLLEYWPDSYRNHGIKYNIGNLDDHLTNHTDHLANHNN